MIVEVLVPPPPDWAPSSEARSFSPSNLNARQDGTREAPIKVDDHFQAYENFVRDFGTVRKHFVLGSSLEH